MSQSPPSPVTEPLMCAQRIPHGLLIGGKVRITMLYGNVSNCWLAIEGPKGETHQIRVTRGGKVFVTKTKKPQPVRTSAERDV